MDQKQAGPQTVSCARARESPNGNAVGLPHLQSATVDPFAKTPNRAGHELDSENVETRKKPRKHLQTHRTYKTPHAPQKPTVRDVFSQLQNGKDGPPNFKSKSKLQ